MRFSFFEFFLRILWFTFPLFVGGAGRFREALIIYIHVLHDLQSALKYCTSVKPEKHGLVYSWGNLRIQVLSFLFRLKTCFFIYFNIYCWFAHNLVYSFYLDFIQIICT